MAIKIFLLEMDLDGFRKNENEKKSGDEKISTEKVNITKSSKVKYQDCNDEHKLGQAKTPRGPANNLILILM